MHNKVHMHACVYVAVQMCIKRCAHVRSAYMCSGAYMCRGNTSGALVNMLHGVYAFLCV